MRNNTQKNKTQGGKKQTKQWLFACGNYYNTYNFFTLHKNS